MTPKPYAMHVDGPAVAYTHCGQLVSEYTRRTLENAEQAVARHPDLYSHVCRTCRRLAEKAAQR